MLSGYIERKDGKQGILALQPFVLSIKSLSSDYAYIEEITNTKLQTSLIAYLKDQLLKSEPEQLLDLIADTFFKRP